MNKKPEYSRIFFYMLRNERNNPVEKNGHIRQSSEYSKFQQQIAQYVWGDHYNYYWM